MRRLPVHFGFVLMLVALAVALSGCVVVPQPPPLAPGIPSGTPLGDSPSTTNGERIYFTATSGRGDTIGYRGGPIWGGMMMGSYLTCAACHGPTARGGEHYMHMTVMDAPDIRISALSSESEEHSGEGDEYTLEMFRNAVENGQHPDGDALSLEMPRWRMSDADLADLFAFLHSLP